MQNQNLAQLLSSLQTSGRDERNHSRLRDLAECSVLSQKHLIGRFVQLPQVVASRSNSMIVFSCDGKTIASAVGCSKIFITDVTTSRIIKTIEGHRKAVWCLTFHPVIPYLLASSCINGDVRIWDIRSSKCEATYHLGEFPGNLQIASMSFHPSRNVLCVCSRNKLHFWDWRQDETFASISTGTLQQRVRFARFDASGSKLITAIVNRNPNDFSMPNIILPHNNRPDMHGPSTSSYSYGAYSSTGSDPYYEGSSTRVFPSNSESSSSDESSDLDFSPSQVNLLQSEALDSFGSSAAYRVRNRAHPSNVARNNLLNRITSVYRRLENLNNDDSANNAARTPVDFSQVDDLSILLQTTTMLERRIETYRQAFMEENLEDGDPNQMDDSDENNQVFNLNNRNRPGGSNRRPSFQPNPRYNINQGLPQPNYIITLINRIQGSLRVMDRADHPLFASEDIQELRTRVSELLTRLANVTNYRERLTGLRHQICAMTDRFLTTENIHPHGPDLIHCFLLVNMVISLTRQMQRILAADLRLSQITQFNLLHSLFGPGISRILTFQPEPSGQAQPQGIHALAANDIALINAGERYGVYGNPRPLHIPDIRLIAAQLNAFHEDRNELARLVEERIDIEYQPPPMAPGNRQPPDQIDLEFLDRYHMSYRIQCWDMDIKELPNFKSEHLNLVVNKCKIADETNIDISSDGQLFACLVAGDTPYSTMVAVYSLKKSTLGQRLFQHLFYGIPRSVSISPLGKYLMVSLETLKRQRYDRPPPAEEVIVIGQLFEIPQKKAEECLCKLLHVMKTIEVKGDDEQFGVNFIRWLPYPTDGFVYFTNKSRLVICRPFSGNLSSQNSLQCKVALNDQPVVSPAPHVSRFLFSMASDLWDHFTPDHRQQLPPPGRNLHM